jgi:hypothetical protein
MWSEGESVAQHLSVDAVSSGELGLAAIERKQWYAVPPRDGQDHAVDEADA